MWRLVIIMKSFVYNLITERKAQMFLWQGVRLVVLGIILIPQLVYGQLLPGPLNPNNYKFEPVTKVKTIEELVTWLIKLFSTLGGILSVLFFMYAGFLYVMAQGDPKKMEKAHRAFWHTVIGTTILVMSTTLATIIQKTIGSITK